MSRSFNQARAALILAKFSLLATLRSPTSVVFSLLFPIIFIVVFGSIKNDAPPTLKVAMAPGCDTLNIIYKAIKSIPNISFQNITTAAQQADKLQKGRITAIINIKPNGIGSIPHYIIHLRSASSSSQSIHLLQNSLSLEVSKIDERIYPHNSP